MSVFGFETLENFHIQITSRKYDVTNISNVYYSVLLSCDKLRVSL